MMNDELRLIGAYIRLVFKEWWFVVVDGTLVLTDFVERIFGTWFLPSTRTKIALGLGVLAVAQYRVYRKLALEFQKSREHVNEQRTKLMIHEDRGSRVYIEHPGMPQPHNCFEFHLGIDNSGPDNSIIRKFDLITEEDRQAHENLVPTRRNMIPTQRGGQQMLAYSTIHSQAYVVVPAHGVWSGILLFELPGRPINAARLDCRLEITDSNGTSAAHTFSMAVQD